MWSSTSSVIRLTAENTLGKTTLGKPKVQKATWFWNEEVQAAIREKKSKYKLWWRTRQTEDRDAYLAAKREAKKAVSKAKSDRYKAVYDMLDTREGERAVYRLVRARHRSTLDMEHIKIFKGADGAVLHRSGQILERWREYYNHLCNEEFCHPPIPTVPSVEGPVLPITAVEVSAALAKMKSNKATGPDDVWKLLGDRGSVWLATLFNKIVAEGRTPDVWRTSVTVPVWKGKGDIADCTSYRRLLCHTMKVFERVLEARLRKIVSVSINQCGFVKDCSTMDAIHAVRILLEKHREKNRSVHLAFLDLEKASDRVPYELLWMSMRPHRVPEEYVRRTKLLYAKPTSVVRCAAGTSRPFPVQLGEIPKQHPWTLLFADDVMLASESRDDLLKQLQSWKDQLQQYGLRFNTSKDGCASYCPLRMRVLVDDESLGKSAARCGDADVEVDDRPCEAKDDRCTFVYGCTEWIEPNGRQEAEKRTLQQPGTNARKKKKKTALRVICKRLRR
ncbi:hypothetical protein RB195_020483 [Necator americanus]|uniref:Reverse transcriptase domain-containing protein n=1 Tax=Necator americanus TaxID=51031 RepID=A0ABR1CJ14_NECAM